MIVTCPACATRYLVDPAALGSQGRMVRCARCADSWFQAPPPPEPASASAPVAPAEPEPVVTPPPNADGSPPIPTEPMPSFIGNRNRLDRSRLPALRTPPPRITSVQIGWAALAGFVLLFLGGLILFHAAIAAAWPATERLYGLVGLSTPGPDTWFELHLKTTPDTADGQKSLIVSGEIANISAAPHSVPKLRVNLLNARKQIVKSWDFQAAGDPVAPGQTVPFQTSITAPPEDTTSVNVNWVTE
jgi:predicted Zn finger-like uncharacterized protein